MTIQDDLITTRDAARVIGCTPRHVTKLYHTGHLRGRFFGPVLQIERSSAERYAASPHKPGWPAGRRRVDDYGVAL